ncbi:MAG: hypothetical protein ACP5Q4_09200, partial [Candidatus Caldatribacteriaceae bacterium]
MTFPQELPDGDKYLELLFVPEKAGEKVERAKLKNVEVQLTQDESGRLLPRFFVSYRNTGNTHLTPSCRVEVNEVPQEQKGVVLERVGALLSLRSEPSQDLVLPGMEGTAVLASDQPLPPGKYRLKVSFFEGEKELLTQETTFTVGKK